MQWWRWQWIVNMAYCIVVYKQPLCKVLFVFLEKEHTSNKATYICSYCAVAMYVYGSLLTLSPPT